MKISIIAVMIVTFLTGVASADTITVGPGAGYDFDNIQAAIDAAVNGDVVLVADGTYTGEGNRDIDFLGKAITVRSENGPENCIIDCNGSRDDPHRGFYFHNDEDANSILAGFTILNGYGKRYGGGIYCEYSSPAVANCTFSENFANHFGGGMYNWESDPIVTNCTFSGNSAHLFGGGIANYESSNPDITNCTFSENFANHFGGGMHNVESNPTVTNSTFSGNSIVDGGGGGIYNYDSSPTVTNCTFNGNSVSDGGGGMDNEYYSNPNITNCTFSGNLAEDGGGLYNEFYSSPTVTKCTFSGNLANGYWRNNGGGGGIGNRYYSSPTITNCRISGNSAEYEGGGIYCEDSSFTISNCIITRNQAHSGGGILGGLSLNSTIKNCTITGNSAEHGGGGVHEYLGQIQNCTITGNSAKRRGGGIGKYNGQISNCIIWNNSAPEDPQLFYPEEPSYSCIQDWTGGGVGNIDADPCFVEAGYWDANGVWVDGDYHLLRGSPCVDAGTDANNYSDIEGNARPFDFPGVDNNGELPEFDMGAYELVPVKAKVQLTPQSLNCSGKGKWVKAHITLPEGFYPEDVDVNEPAVAYPMEADSEYITVLGGDKGPVRLEVVFGRGAFCDSIIDDYLDITIIGSLTNGRYFYGIDTIRIITQRSPRRGRR